MAITMEELKQKAKAYDEALESAKDIVNNQNASSVWKDWLRDTLPELKESNGEEIRKEILSLIQYTKGRLMGYEPRIHQDEMIAWLEKQGEKPQGKSALESWKDMRLEVYQQASGNRHEPNYSDDATKMFSLNDIDEIFEKIAEKKELKKLSQQEVTKISFKVMPKIGGKYVQLRTENLLKQINSEVSITKRHHLINRYLNQREKQIENILANIEDDDIDLTLVVEQLWEDIQLAHKQIRHTIDRIDFYADYHALDKWDGKFNG